MNQTVLSGADSRSQEGNALLLPKIAFRFLRIHLSEVHMF